MNFSIDIHNYTFNYRQQIAFPIQLVGSWFIFALAGGGYVELRKFLLRIAIVERPFGMVMLLSAVETVYYGFSKNNLINTGMDSFS